MRIGEAPTRLLRDERGFSLPEVLVTMLMMLTVLFALYSIFDMSLRVFSFGNDKVEAVENARLGMERMEREIRAAYPQDDGTLLTTHETDAISFSNRTSADSSEAEQITYTSYTPGDSSMQELGRSVDDGDEEPVVESLDELTFDYIDGSGNPAEDESEPSIVRITLDVEVPGDPPRSQTLTTEVSLRNAQSE